jgi:8-oxo-dGTP diphosphatase
MSTELRPKVGVGVMIFKDDKVLMSMRKGGMANGEYQFPGGHLEHLESFEECARREVREECGIEITNIRFSYVGNGKRYAPKHYVHIGLIADWHSGEPKQMEPEKSGPWDWYAVDSIPKPTFYWCDLQIRALKEGLNYFDNVI